LREQCHSGSRKPDYRCPRWRWRPHGYGEFGRYRPVIYTPILLSWRKFFNLTKADAA